MMNRLNQAIEQFVFFKADLARSYKGNLAIGALKMLMNPALLATFLYRLSRFFFLIRLSLVSKVIYVISRILFGVEIHYMANIGPGFLLAHGIGTVIGSQVVIGQNVMISQGVTLGNNFSKEREIRGVLTSQPQIGDECFILSGAKVNGPIIVAEKTILGANAVLTKDTESNCIYAGVPARKLGINRRKSHEVGAGTGVI